ncbi:unnamed protein product [Trichobilharzia regenti]|nr:unnamed protein product [Trichobilharzia regenti]
MSAHTSTSQPVERLNQSHEEPSDNDLSGSNPVLRNHQSSHITHSSRDSLTSLSPDQMLAYGAKQIIRLVRRFLALNLLVIIRNGLCH